jgi:hypothetical protein
MGKMISSSQGPKGKVFHLSATSSAPGTVPGNTEFISCGEKHFCFWSMPVAGGTLKNETGKLGEHKNKMMLCVVRGKNGVNVFGTSEGDLLLGRGANLLADTSHQLGKSEKNKYTGNCHDSAVNALWSSSDMSIVVSGGKDGVVKVCVCVFVCVCVVYVFAILQSTVFYFLLARSNFLCFTLLLYNPNITSLFWFHFYFNILLQFFRFGR